MASGIVEEIKEEVTCPICLELLTEPLSLGCGHSFCQACITANKESMIRQEGESRCPVCRTNYQPEKLQPSWKLSNIVETLQRVKLSTEEERKRDLCVHHGEKLHFFCEEHGKLICFVCERSQEHRGHKILVKEEAAQEYKEKLQADLARLRGKQKKAKKWGSDIRKESNSRQNQVQKERERVQDYFEHLREILDTEEQKELQKLEEEERDDLKDLAQAESELVQQGQLLTDLISDLEHRLQGSTAEMLQDVNGIIERSKTFTLKKPKTLPKKQVRVFQGPDLRKVLPACNELTDARRYWVHVTLDPPTDKENVIISADWKQVRPAFYLRKLFLYQKGDYEDYGVLGSPPMTSGKHYWEVDVSEKYAWVLGVCEENPPGSNRKGFVRRGNNRQHVCSRYQPRNGYWVIGLENHSKYKAFVDSPSSHSSTLTFTLTVPPHRVGVFLEYDAGTVSFFNITNHGFLIYKFSACSFSGKMFPYFNPMKCTAPMTLCSPSS
nr:tripartite motif containing 5 alpha [Miniopterus fuliginosus]